MYEFLLTSERQVSLGGSLLVMVALLAPFGLAYVISVYENRLLYYFSEGKEVLPKGQLITSVLSTVMYPLIAMSFGLIGVAKLFSQIGFEDVALKDERPTWAWLMYIGITLVLSLALITWSRHRASKRWFKENLPLQRLYRRWLWWLAWVGQVILLTFFWLMIAIFPQLTSIVIT